MSLNTAEVHEVVVGEAPGEITARSPLQLFWRRFRKDRVAIAALCFIVVLILVALAAPLIIKALDLRPLNAPAPEELDLFGQPSGPSSVHPLGVDELGRDVLARIIYGARVSLEVAFISTGLAFLSTSRAVHAGASYPPAPPGTPAVAAGGAEFSSRRRGTEPLVQTGEYH